MKEISKKDSGMASRVFLGKVGTLPGSLIDSEIYAGRADIPLKGATEYINIEKAWHSNNEIPDDVDLCLLDLGSREYDLGRIYINSFGKALWQSDLADWSTGTVRRWAYIKDLLPSRK